MTPVLVAAGVALLVRGGLARLPHRPPRPRRPTRHHHRARVLLTGLLAATLLVTAPPLAMALIAVWWARRHLRERRQASRRADDITRALPDTVDLLILASSAGLGLPLAHPLVAALAPAPVGDALLAAEADAQLGRPRADALLASLEPLGERAHALGQVLGDHLRYGVPLLPALERARFELGLDRRRRAELAARRVPVQLLGPLVTCVLPAFGLLTVVPLLGASLRALPT